MDKFLDFIKKNKATLIIVLGAISGFIIAIMGIDGIPQAILSILSGIVAIIGVFTMYLKEGYSDKLLTIIINIAASMTKVIIEKLKEKDVKPETVASVLGVELKDNLFVGDIKDQLIDEYEKLKTVKKLNKSD